jgi:predicted RNA-binding protein with PUA-like domain
MKNYWLLKSEPDVYSIDDLARERISLWDGVRNYQARNFLKAMSVGDLAFFYHSNTTHKGIVGLMEAIEVLVVDPTQFDPGSDYYDRKATVESPRWHTVRFQFVSKFTDIITLADLQYLFSGEEFPLVRRGNRLSVMPVSTAIVAELQRRYSLSGVV